MMTAPASRNAPRNLSQHGNPLRLVLRRLCGATALAATLLAVVPDTALAAPRHIPVANGVAAPAGARDLCARYAWACRPSKQGVASSDAMLSLANDVNRAVNRRVPAIDDLSQYRVKDYWTLPSAKGGDCEDVALLKKRELIKRGVPADRLLIATVHSRKIGAHAVLVLRMDDGDKVLDSLNTRIKPWHQTGYTFLRVQNPDAPTTWVGVSPKG